MHHTRQIAGHRASEKGGVAVGSGASYYVLLFVFGVSEVSIISIVFVISLLFWLVFDAEESA